MIPRQHRGSCVRIVCAAALILCLFAGVSVGQAAPRASYDSRIATLVGRVSQDTLRSRVTWLESFGTRYYTTNACAQVATGIQQYFQELGLSTTIQTFSIPGHNQTFSNVIATIPGKRDASRIYLLGAHYDSISNRATTNAPGADDNASGTAALMEIARVLASYTFDYTITFVAFGAEEAGLYGSYAYAAAAKQRGDQIVGMLDLDMVGFVDQPNEDLNLGINTASRWLADAFAAASPLYVPLQVTVTHSGESDHESFWMNGYDAILIIDDDPVTNPNYHRTSDTSSTLDFAFLTQMTQASLAALADLAVPIGPTDAVTGTVTPSRLYFGSLRSDGTLSTISGGQSVVLTFDGSTAPAWTATSDQPWLVVTGGAGVGAGRFTVSVVAPVPVPVGWALGGNVTVTGPGIANAPIVIPVTFSMYPADTSRAPLGMVDTPLQNAANVVGTIAITGWAIDEIDIDWIRVYRNCLPFEPSGNCQTLDGASVVYVGDATRVEGARPDILNQAPTYPQANRAGWGYLLLTNLLPHVPRSEMFGGQGALTLYVRAKDVDGHEVWLGRTSSDTVPTSLTLANDTIAVPFGAIDTPSQGATVSGTLANFGWALTPDTNTTSGDVGDILVPTNGSTLRVYIDGVAGATIAYNQCRGSVASGPVPAGVYCDDDVANIFGTSSPSAAVSPRTSNPTKYRNLDAGRGAIGALLIDTRTLTNGVHTIMWGVTDSNGRGEGLGSRYFTVLNTGGDAAPLTWAPTPLDPARGKSVGAQSRRGKPDATTPPGIVRARIGLDAAPPWVTLEPDDDGVRHVSIPAMGRLELDLGGPVDRAFLLGESGPLDAPPGSHLDVARGIWTWAPGLAYLGTFRLVFARATGNVAIDVTIVP